MTTNGTDELYHIPDFVGVSCDETFHSTVADLQTDADFHGFIVREANAGLLKGLLYLEDGGEVSFHDPLALLNALQRRQANPGGAGKLSLAPA
jgi:hypothetical protein